MARNFMVDSLDESVCYRYPVCHMADSLSLYSGIGTKESTMGFLDICITQTGPERPPWGSWPSAVTLSLIHI